jgi:hypothetical protein
MARVFEVERFGVPGDDVLVKLPLGVEGLDITRRASDGFRAVKNIDEGRLSCGAGAGSCHPAHPR